MREFPRSGRVFLHGPGTAISALLLATFASAAHSATFTVNALTDAGDANAGNGICETAAGNNVCTLRAAIQEANALAGADTIQFSVTGTIAVTSALPNITASLNIDGPTPAGSVVVNGTGSPNNFSLFRFTGTATGDYNISNLTIRNGRTTDSAGGGGIFFGPTAFSAMGLTDVRVENSQAAGGPGGGIALSGNNELQMTGGAVTGNSSTTGNGGGISVTTGKVVLTDVTVSGNTAANGGGVGLTGAEFELTRSTLSGNTASQDGGGLYLGLNNATFPSPASSSAKLSNCTISGNQAANGGGIGANQGNNQSPNTTNRPSSMIHCTVAQNSASTAGGGLGVSPLPPASNANAFFPGNASNPFTSNIIAGNTANQPNTGDCRTAFSHSGSASGYNISGTDSTAQNPGCGFTQATDRVNVGAGCTNALADRLGKTQTRGLAGNCILADRALDRANPAHATTTDQRGAPLADGDESGLAQRDIGAYEFGGYGVMSYVSPTYSVREDGGVLKTQVRRYANLATASSVDYATADCSGTNCPNATAGADYTTTTGTLSWGANAGGTMDINVPILDDDILDNSTANPPTKRDEIFRVLLSNANKGADLAQASTAVTITDWEPGAVVIDANLSMNGVQAAVTVDETAPNVTLSTQRQANTGADGTITVRAKTVDGTAKGGPSCTAGVDYISFNSIVTIADGQVDGITDQAITICDDNEFESNETFTLELSEPSGGSRLGTPSVATVTITCRAAVQDDPLTPQVDETDPGTCDAAVRGSLQFTASNFAVNEQDGEAIITVSRTGGDDGAASVNYRTSAGTAGAGRDYSTTSGTLTWAADEAATKTFTVPIINDEIREGVETFSVILSGAVGATLGSPGTATVSITSEDKMKFRFTQMAWTAIEGSPARILVEPIQPVVDGPYTINYSTSDGTATAGADYTATTGTLAFSNGETAAKEFEVPITADGAPEGDETLNVMLSTASPTGEITGTNPTVITISEDGFGFALSAAQYAGAEGGAGITVTVHRIGAASGAVSVDYSTSDGTATAGSDYTPASGTLEWDDGDTEDKTVTVVVTDDSLDELDETLGFALSMPSEGGVILSPGSATLTIADNDNAPTLAISDAAASEGSGEDLDFTVTLSAASGRTVTVNYQSADGTATAGDDYTPVSGTLTFLPGETEKTISVEVLVDAEEEADETLTVTLLNADGATLADATGTGTILDDDAGIVFVETDGSTEVIEGRRHTDTFTVHLASQPSANVTITLDAGTQLTVEPATLSFTPANFNTPQEVTVMGVRDRQREGDHSANITATGASTDAAYDGRTKVLSVVISDPKRSGGGGAFGLLNLLLLLPAAARLRRRR